MSMMNIYIFAITLILVMDPLGNVPVFLSILKNIDHKRQVRIIFRESLIAFGILSVFLFFGGHILKGLSIAEPALAIAGAIILFLISLRMIFPSHDKNMNDDVAGEPFIVPLAVPLTAGPAAMATVMLFASREPEMMMSWFVGVVIASTVCMVVLLCAPILMRVLGQKMLTAVERLMGMILTTLAVQMFLNGIGEYFHL